MMKAKECLFSLFVFIFVYLSLHHRSRLDSKISIAIAGNYCIIKYLNLAGLIKASLLISEADTRFLNNSSLDKKSLADLLACF